jgi:hypothetical protein
VLGRAEQLGLSRALAGRLGAGATKLRAIIAFGEMYEALILARLVEHLRGQGCEDGADILARLLMDSDAATLPGGPPSSVEFAVPRFQTKEGRELPGTITLPDDDTATVPLIFRDGTQAVHAPATGGAVAVDNPAVATAELSPADDSVLITAMGDGDCTVTYTNGGLSDTLTVHVQAPAPTAVEFNAGGATFAPKP